MSKPAQGAISRRGRGREHLAWVQEVKDKTEARYPGQSSVVKK